MKQYVIDLANDIVANDAFNELMKRDIKEMRAIIIKYILKDYQAGLMTSYEAVYQLSDIAR